MYVSLHVKCRLFFSLCNLEGGTDTCPETSVKNYYSTLRNIPEERRSQTLICRRIIIKALSTRNVSRKYVQWEPSCLWVQTCDETVAIVILLA
jgi:hypothetical protein